MQFLSFIAADSACVCGGGVDGGGGVGGCVCVCRMIIYDHLEKSNKVLTQATSPSFTLAAMLFGYAPCTTRSSCT